MKALKEELAALKSKISEMEISPKKIDGEIVPKEEKTDKKEGSEGDEGEVVVEVVKRKISLPSSQPLVKLEGFPTTQGKYFSTKISEKFPQIFRQIFRKNFRIFFDPPHLSQKKNSSENAVYKKKNKNPGPNFFHQNPLLFFFYIFFFSSLSQCAPNFFSVQESKRPWKTQSPQLRQ